MKAVLFRRAAQYDLQDIWMYVAKHNPETADEWHGVPMCET